MNRLANFIASGKITVEELATAPELIERAKFVTEALNACKKTIQFPFGTSEIDCYFYRDGFGEYEAWGTCNSDGLFTCSCNWGGNHVIGRVNLTNSGDVFMAFDNQEFCSDLKRFLSEQIEKAPKM